MGKRFSRKQRVVPAPTLEIYYEEQESSSTATTPTMVSRANSNTVQSSKRISYSQAKRAVLDFLELENIVPNIYENLEVVPKSCALGTMCFGKAIGLKESLGETLYQIDRVEDIDNVICMLKVSKEINARLYKVFVALKNMASRDGVKIVSLDIQYSNHQNRYLDIVFYYTL